MKSKKEPTIELVLHTTFSFSYWENVTNVTMSLAQAGYFVQVHKRDSAYEVEVYKRDNRG